METVKKLQKYLWAYFERGQKQPIPIDSRYT